jgi:gluconolactonase
MTFNLKITILISLLSVLLTNSNAQDLTVEKLSNNQFGFVEGPAWDGYNLYFSDLRTNRIYKYNRDFGFVEFISNPFSTNGIVHREGILYICESGSGRVISADTLGNYQDVYLSSFNGESLNSPNDLCLDENGGIYFTDPAFGFNPIIVESVYYISPDLDVVRVHSHQEKPNGILYSEEKKRIFVSDTYGKYIYSYDVSVPGIASDTSIFAELQIAEFRQDDFSGADGMCFDKNEYLYVTTELGVQVFNPEGDFQYLIEVPETPTNCTFGGKNLDELYITAQKNVYRVKIDLELNTGIHRVMEEATGDNINYDCYTSTFDFSQLLVKASYWIYNLQGKLIATGVIQPGGSETIPLESGIYLLQVEGNGIWLRKKILVQ